MNTIKQWFCKSCRTVKERSAFPKYFDAATPCTDCQRGHTPATPPEAAAAEQVVTVHRRGYVRRHGEDRRDD